MNPPSASVAFNPLTGTSTDYGTNALAQVASRNNQTAFNQSKGLSANGSSAPTVITDANTRESTIPRIVDTSNNLTQTPSNSGQPNSNTNTNGQPNGTSPKTGNPTTDSYEDIYSHALNDLSGQPTSSSDLAIMNNIKDMQQRSDASTAAQLSAVSSAFKQRQDMLHMANAAGAAHLSAFLGSSGAVRSASGNMLPTTFEQSNIMALSELDSQEATAKAAIYKAQSEMDFQLMDKANQNLKEIQDKKSALAGKIADQVVAQNKEAQARIDKVKDDINQVVENAAKNGAPKEIIDAIHTAGDVGAAVAAAGNYLQTGTGDLGNYLEYKRETESKGLVPKDYQTYLNDKRAQDLKDKKEEAYATQAARNLADANSTASDKVQQKLEQQYRQVLAKENSARSGSIGIENAKVNQANHLNSLITQYYDPKTGKYNIPTAQYSELVLGLASLVANNGNTSEGERAQIQSKTLAGDVNGLAQFLTGTPKNGNTQDIIKNLVDSVDRQAETAIRNREAALDTLRFQAPTDLEQSRIDALNRSTQMVGYEGQDRADKSSVDLYVKSNPTDADTIAKMFEVPGATNSSVLAWLKANGKI